MIRCLALFPLALLAQVSASFAQAPSYTLTVTAAEAGLLGEALADRPFRQVAPLIRKLNAQVQAQDRALAERAQPAAPAAPPAAKQE